MPVANNTSNHHLKLFFLYSFLFSWTLWLPGFLITHEILRSSPALVSISNILKWVAGTGPSLAALFLTIQYDGKRGLLKLLKRVVDVKLGYWYFPALLLLPFVLVTAHLLNALLFGVSFPTSGLLKEFWWIPIVFLTFIVMQFSEELGWRGYALDRLQKRWNAVISSILLGIAWAIWHLPMFFISGYGQFENHLPYGQFFITIVLMSIIITWIQNNTGGSLVPAFILHASINLSGEILPFVSGTNGHPDNPTAWIICNLILFILVIVVIFVYGDKSLVRRQGAASQSA